MMISDEDLACKVSELVLEANRLMNEALSLVAESGSVDELKNFRLAVGKVSAELLFAIANPLYREHPELKPQGLFVPRA